jgi:3-dehydroquinate synthase
MAALSADRSCKMNKIEIKSMRYDYDVVFIDNLTKEIQNITSQFGTAFIIDENIWNLYKDQLGIDKDNHKIYLVSPTEENKTLDGVISVLEFWESQNVQRTDKIIVIGGGIVQDIGTFASHIYLRNMDWYFFPTTLLSQCDSCIGAKCGINFHHYKNRLGVFHAPKKVFIYTEFLNTLDINDIYSGLGEIIKLYLTDSKEYFELLKTSMADFANIKKNIQLLIYNSLLAKKKVIELDEYENDYRRILNYGHTFGHAIESYTNNEIPHGIGVIWGIDMANFISYKKGILAQETYLEIKNFIKEYFPIQRPVVKDMDRYMQAIRKDKKAASGIVNAILLHEIGDLRVVKVNVDHEFEALIKEYFEVNDEFFGN